MRVTKAIRKKLMWFFVSIQYLVALFFACATFIISSPELQISTGALAVAFASAASTDISHLQDSRKLDKILKLVKEIKQNTNNVEGNRVS